MNKYVTILTFSFSCTVNILYCTIAELNRLFTFKVIYESIMYYYAIQGIFGERQIDAKDSNNVIFLALTRPTNFSAYWI